MTGKINLKYQKNKMQESTNRFEERDASRPGAILQGVIGTVERIIENQGENTTIVYSTAELTDDLHFVQKTDTARNFLIYVQNLRDDKKMDEDLRTVLVGQLNKPGFYIKVSDESENPPQE